MIALTMGLMITVSLGYIMMGSRSTYRTQDASARLQDTGRFAMEFIGRQLRSAGRTDITPLASDGRVAFGDAPINTADSSGTQLKVQYQLTDMGGQAIQDCNGAIAGITTSKIMNLDGTVAGHYGTVINTISLDGQKQLQCNGNGGGSQPFAEKVEELQFRYTSDNATWTTVPANPVLAVEVCFRVRSINNGVANTAQNYKDCTGADHTPTDAYLRRSFTSVFALRNNLNALPTP